MRRPTGGAVAAALGSAAAALGVGAGAAVAYYASRMVQRPGDVPPVRLPDTRVRVVEVHDDRVVLGGPGAGWDGWWGVTLDDAHLLVGPPTAPGPRRRDEVVRPLVLRRGDPAAGDEGHLSAFAFPDDPSVLGRPFREEVVHGSVGAMPAWYLRPSAPPADPGDEVLAVVVHGRSARRAEGLRHAGPLLDAGLSCLLISYRDDHEGAASPDGLGHLGATEWEDVVAALDHGWALGHRRFVLVGLSMGGALALRAVRRWQWPGAVVGLVLDAPVLDWDPVLRSAARSRGIPDLLVPALVPLAMSLAGRRAGIDFAELRALEHAHVFDRPTLLLHGTADEVVPVALSDQLAGRHRDTVTYVRVGGARHVAAWNTDRDRVEAALRAFARPLADVA